MEKGMYRVAYLHANLGRGDLDLGTSPDWWATTVATYSSSRMVEHPKNLSQPNPGPRPYETPCRHVIRSGLITCFSPWPVQPQLGERQRLRWPQLDGPEPPATPGLPRQE